MFNKLFRNPFKKTEIDLFLKEASVGIYPFKYSCRFKKLSNYNETVVSVSFTLPFRKLHLIYLFPLQILSSYWSEILRKVPERYRHYCLEDMADHMKEIEEFFPSEKVNADNKFPHLIKTDKNDWQ